MNWLGNDSVEGDGKLVRHVAIIAGGIVVATLLASAVLDKAANNGSLAAHLPWSQPANPLSRLPRPDQPVVGIRYGNVDYMPTASVPSNKQRVKNAVSDPALGMPN